jgi:Potential Queuosine, Q, salvage protein family
VLRYDPALAAHIDAERLLPPGREEREIRACALHACERLAEHTGIPPRVLDLRFWNRGQAPEYKAVPRHRTRCVYY